SSLSLCYIFYFFFNDPATTEIYTLSLHDALPICQIEAHDVGKEQSIAGAVRTVDRAADGILHGVDERDADVGERHAGEKGSQGQDRKSTRLNSSHVSISYAVFCLKKKKKKRKRRV